MSKLRAVFLDRDGVINLDNGYVNSINDFIFTPNIMDILAYLQNKGFLLFIITNQSGIARGYYKKEDFHVLTNWMLQILSKNGITISQVEFCPHLESDNCQCRKPKTGMIDNILKNYDIDLKNSWLIGDKMSDIECGINAGVANMILIDKHTTNCHCQVKVIGNISQIKDLVC